MIIRIAHLYPDMLNLYGDRGNIIALTERMHKRYRNGDGRRDHGQKL